MPHFFPPIQTADGLTKPRTSNQRASSIHQCYFGGYRCWGWCSRSGCADPTRREARRQDLHTTHGVLVHNSIVEMWEIWLSVALGKVNGVRWVVVVTRAAVGAATLNIPF